MGAKVGSVVAAVGYTLVGAVLFGGIGILVGILLNPNAGLEGVLNAVIAGGVGAVAGGIVGAVVYVWGGRALERQQGDERRALISGSSQRCSGNTR